MTPLPHSATLQSLLHLMQSHHSLLMEGLPSSAKAYFVSMLCEKLQLPVIVITGGIGEDGWIINSSFFSKQKPIELPAWEVLPGENITPNADIMGTRLKALQKLSEKQKAQTLISSTLSVMQKVLPKKSYQSIKHHIKAGQEWDYAFLCDLLDDLGFTKAPVVSDKGEYAIRGGILDLYPIDSVFPYRLEFFGDTVDNIRTFDPQGQKSIAKEKELFFGPANEKKLTENSEDLVSIFDLFDTPPLIVFDDLLAIEDQLVSVASMPGIKSNLIFPFSEILAKISSFPTLFLTNQPIDSLFPYQKQKQLERHQQITFDWANQSFETIRLSHPFLAISQFFEGDSRVIDELAQSHPPLKHLFISKKSKQEQLHHLLKERQIPADDSIFTGEVTEGFVLADIPFAVISDHELFGMKAMRRSSQRQSMQTPLAEFHQLTPGDYVVHTHSGIGKYLGTEKQTDHRGITSEYLTIEYAENSRLYVPMAQSHLVSRYIGAKESKTLTLSALGSKKWLQIKSKAQNEIVGYAAELLELYAQRELDGGFSHGPDSDDMKAFEDSFPYLETPDQLAAIQDVKNDMQSKKPMDRLVCGDVGYGKTEVAMRAAFKCVFDGKKQVAVLVPTTVLAMQHYDTFKERMKDYPIEIRVMSRAQTPKEHKKILQEISDGKIDILIGTHRILSKDISFYRIGLIIIDEEQRFGVKAKEKIKTLKANIDCLTLSATPIPRTLYFSLVQLRNMSVISTPPQNRIPIKTIIAENTDEVIQNALLREKARGGQSFFIHNRVESIDLRASHVKTLFPSSRLSVVHGQMDADTIDLIFHQFKEGDVDLLFATTLIENGIDVPNANTIIVDRAHQFGLADLYQLRGRVGRSNRPAYAYLLVPKRTSDISRKRLSALLEASGYGGGMKIAMRDLEIRGAGDILGTRQSGQVSAVGFHLYCKMLKKAIDALKQKIPTHFIETKLEFSFDASIPEDYIPQTELRMELYHRFGEANSFDDIDLLFEEVKDRFGTPPKAVIFLYHLSRIRVFASANEFKALTFKETSLIAEQKKVKKTLSFPIPKEDPRLLESLTFGALMNHFPLKWTPAEKMPAEIS
jgi:transcription-repair coupling factor (superfamily II helicase)